MNRNSGRISAVANFYDISKLPAPYTDNCFDFTNIGYKDFNDYCSSMKSNGIYLSGYKTIWKSVYNSSKRAIARYWERDIFVKYFYKNFRQEMKSLENKMAC